MIALVGQDKSIVITLVLQTCGILVGCLFVERRDYYMEAALLAAFNSRRFFGLPGLFRLNGGLAFRQDSGIIDRIDGCILLKSIIATFGRESEQTEAQRTGGSVVERPAAETDGDNGFFLPFLRIKRNQTQVLRQEQCRSRRK